MQVCSLSYHAAFGNIVAGLLDGQVEMWQTDPHIAPAPQAALPAHECVRERLAEAQMSREQELKRSIADLEAKCAHSIAST